MKEEGVFRQKLAKQITIFAISGTILLGTIGIIFAIIERDFTILQYVFGALLPLWGTWIGTIMAFYFSKENFESASRNTKDILDKVITAQDKLKSIKVEEVMIDINQISYFKLEDNKEFDEVLIKDLRERLTMYNRSRLPVITEDNRIKSIIHLSTIDKFIADVFSINSSEFSYDELTIAKAKKNRYFNDVLLNGFKILKRGASLLEAQKLMESNKLCNDVFITENGSANEPIIGWVTNITISEKAQLK